MRARWKSRFSDSLLHLAVVLSILRTDLRVYFRQYSAYPEVQQALLGQSVGLHLVDSYHNNDLSPHPSSKYIIDDNEHIFNELHRLVGSTRLFQRNIEASVTTWLVTNNSSVIAPTPATSGASGTAQELSAQDVQLIEDLWKQDVESLVGRGQFSINSKEMENSTTDSNYDEGIAENFDLSPVPNSTDDTGLLPWTLGNNGTSFNHPPYNTQSSLEIALQDLMPDDQNDMLPITGVQATNSSFLHPDSFPAQYSELHDGVVDTNNTGVLWANQLSDDLSIQESEMDLETIYGANSNLFPILDAIDELGDSMDILKEMDLDIDPGMLTYLGGDEDYDRVSIDSAVGSSPTHSWCDDSVTGGSERHSISSSDQLEFEDGAVGYTKTEPFEQKYYDPTQRRWSKQETSAVSHDHTYGAPPGGVPHVRKMDIKTVKEPSRGLAHDEQLCKKFNIPFTVNTIINTPVDAFNSLLQSHKLSPKQISLVRDIRRRGKNKVAAQNCRQKRVGEHSELEVEVLKLKAKRDSLFEKHAVLLNKTTQTKKHIDIMSTEIFRTLRDENGIPYNTSQFSLEVGRDGEIHVMSSQETQRTRGSKKREVRKRRS